MIEPGLSLTIINEGGYEYDLNELCNADLERVIVLIDAMKAAAQIELQGRKSQ